MIGCNNIYNKHCPWIGYSTVAVGNRWTTCKPQCLWKIRTHEKGYGLSCLSLSPSLSHALYLHTHLLRQLREKQLTVSKAGKLGSNSILDNTT